MNQTTPTNLRPMARKPPAAFIQALRTLLGGPTPWT
jgi:hypothetical protein